MVLAACSTPRPTLTVSAVAALHELPPLPAGPLRISAKVTETGQTTQFPVQTVTYGRAAVFTSGHEVKSPMAYSLPGVPVAASSSVPPNFPVTPSVPTNYRKVAVGWDIQVLPHREGGLITLTAKVKRSTLHNRKGVYGEGSDPVVAISRGLLGQETQVNLTENVAKIPLVVTKEYSLEVRALPGKPYMIPLEDGSSLVISVETA